MGAWDALCDMGVRDALCAMGAWGALGSMDVRLLGASAVVQLVFLVQQLHEVLVREVWSPEAFLDLEERGVIPASAASPLYSEAVQLPTPANRAFYGAARRLHSILTSQNALASIPRNLTARRRITFFCNSVFMRMPTAVPVGHPGPSMRTHNLTT